MSLERRRGAVCGETIVMSGTLRLVLCFFFQAEDGIRDGTVTGVQTCALPIFTMVGCFTTGQIGSHEKFVLAKPIVGSVASVPEATCTAGSGDQLIKLQDLKQVHQIGRASCRERV